MTHKTKTRGSQDQERRSTTVVYVITNKSGMAYMLRVEVCEL